MSSTVAAILTMVGLTVWHLRTRRHPCWSASADARFYIVAGYPAVAIAVFWLVGAATRTGWEWAIGNAWALAAMVSFVCGFNALHRACEQQQEASMTIESIDSDADADADSDVRADNDSDEARPTRRQGSNGSSHA
ncbi:hypothetical protein [Mycolicibacterium stellerae]|uniref:hypothetical protein n=1 Tax=Mycolicibacterium stellerae TaxID=2358193 RepID=UPI0019D0A24D|nr:hypothetical protein [Mycolicibacterium stellerae]